MSFSVKTLVVGPIEENCYVLKDDATGEGVIIDAGDDGEKILDYVKDAQIDVKLLINTHGHWDHIGEIDYLRDELKVPFAIHGADASMLDDSAENLSKYMHTAGKKRPAEIILKDGDVVNFGKSSLRVIHTPGHTKGGVCFYGGGCLFSGDTLFAREVGRTDLPGGSYEELMYSVNYRLQAVADAAKVYPGHGPASDMATERKYNPYIVKE